MSYRRTMRAIRRNMARHPMDPEFEEPPEGKTWEDVIEDVEEAEIARWESAREEREPPVGWDEGL